LLFRQDKTSTIALLPDSKYHKLPDNLDIDWFKKHLHVTISPASIDTNTKISQHKSKLYDKHSKFSLVDWSRKIAVESGYIDCYIKEGLDDDASANMSSSSLMDNMHGGLVVIAGHPGTGKTTLLSYICYRMSDPSSKFLPVFVQLKEFSVYCESFESFIFSGLNNNLSLSILQQVNDEYRFQCAILFDGLDEVAPEVYDKIKVEINRIVAQNQWLTCIFTTRIDGYKNTKQADFRIAKPYTIARLDEDIVRTYIDKWFISNQQQANEIRNKIFADPKLKELAQKAIFMLGLMCLIFEQDNTLESNMSLLYKKSVEYLINTRRNLLERERTLRLEAFKIIALRFLQMQQKIFDGILTEAIIGSFLKEKLEGGEDENAIDFLKKLITETGLLQSHSGNFSFTHLTFQEYFIAQAAIDSIVFNQESLLVYCNMPTWHEIFRLYFGLLSSREDRNTFLKN
jgi:predicted NACHT family NTPase